MAIDIFDHMQNFTTKLKCIGNIEWEKFLLRILKSLFLLRFKSKWMFHLMKKLSWLIAQFCRFCYKSIAISCSKPLHPFVVGFRAINFELVGPCLWVTVLLLQLHLIVVCWSREGSLGQGELTQVYTCI